MERGFSAGNREVRRVSGIICAKWYDFSYFQGFRRDGWFVGGGDCPDLAREWEKLPSVHVLVAGKLQRQMQAFRRKSLAENTLCLCYPPDPVCAQRAICYRSG